MPESKKLSELIMKMFMEIENYRVKCQLKINNYSEMQSKFSDISKQIDQKFDELRCECRKEETTKIIPKEKIHYCSGRKDRSHSMLLIPYCSNCGIIACECRCINKLNI